MDKITLLNYVIEQLKSVDVNELESMCIDSDDMTEGSSIYIRLYLDENLQCKHKKQREHLE